MRSTAEYVKSRLSLAEPAHDWWHVSRVWHNAVHIAQSEGAELLVVELAALLHDISDWKANAGDDTVGPRMAAEWLRSLGAAERITTHVRRIIEAMPFRGADTSSRMDTLEGMVVQDADRLDAIGAIGIARAFAYGGHIGQALYDPALEPVRHRSFEEYKRSKTTTVNHFHEKLLLIKQRMNTNTARRIAEERHRFMVRFLEEFLAEWRAAGE